MTLQIKIPNIFKKVKSEHFFGCFLVLFWTKELVFKYLLQFFKAVPFVGQFYEYVFPISTILLLVLSVGYIVSRIRFSDIIFYVACLSVVLLTILLFPENSVFVMDRLYKTVVIGITMYFIGVCYSNPKYKNWLYYASLVNVGTTFLYQFYQLLSGQILIFDNMDASYKLLPSVMFICYWLFEKFNAVSLIASLVGVFVIFSYGTRGPVLAIMVFFLLAVVLKFITTRVFNKLFLLCLLIIPFLIIILNDELMLSISKALTDLFGQMGLSTRIFDMFSIGIISDGAGRDVLADTVYEAIAERPFIGYGLMGDRVILGKYVHNIILELWCDFGLILGSAIMIALVFIYVRAIYMHRKSSDMYFVLAMVCMIVVKLLLSGSFVYDQYFYLILGICIAVPRRDNEYRIVKFI